MRETRPFDAWNNRLKHRRLMTILFACLVLSLMHGMAGIEAQEKIAQLVVNNPMYDIAWSPNGERMAVAFDNGIGIYTATLQQIDQIETDSLVTQVSWSADNNQLASIGLNDPTVKIWRWDANADTFVLDRTLTNAHGYSFVTAVAWSPNGEWLAIFTDHQPQGAAYVIGTTEIWNTQSWTLRNSLLDEHQFAAPYLEWSPDGNQLAGAASVCIASEFFSCEPPYFYTADKDTGELTYRSLSIMPDLYTLAWAGNRLAVGNAEEILLFDTTINQTIATFPNGSPDGRGRLALDWHSSGKYLVTAHFRGGHIEIINVETGATLLQFSTGELNDIDLSPDDRKLATINTPARLIEIFDIPLLPDDSGTATVTPLPTLTPSWTPTVSITPTQSFTHRP